jgi:hypothetical protein
MCLFCYDRERAELRSRAKPERDALETTLPRIEMVSHASVYVSRDKEALFCGSSTALAMNVRIHTNYVM